MRSRIMIPLFALALMLSAGNAFAQTTGTTGTTATGAAGTGTTGTTGTTATTPGTPNTGAGGNVAQNAVILGVSAAIAAGALYALRRRTS